PWGGSPCSGTNGMGFRWAWRIRSPARGFGRESLSAPVDGENDLVDGASLGAAGWPDVPVSFAARCLRRSSANPHCRCRGVPFRGRPGLVEDITPNVMGTVFLGEVLMQRNIVVLRIRRACEA